MHPVHKRIDKSHVTSLAVAAQGGDGPALERLFLCLLGWVRATVFKELRLRGQRLDDADVDDIAQEILLDIWRKDLGRFLVERGDFLAFVISRVRWRLTDEVRKRTRHVHGSLEEGLEVEARGGGPEERVAAAMHELRLVVLPGLVERALHDDDAARAAVVQNDLEDRPLREVAVGLGVHTSNACRARKRGLELLAARLPAEMREAA